jgi:phosphoglycerate dehydrogenase-like enzyme
MTDTGVATTDTGTAHRLYLLYGDSTFAGEASDALRGALPPGWLLADEPDGATVILAVGVPLDADVIKRAGDGLRLIGTTAPLADEAAGASDARVVTIPTESDLSRRVVAEYAVAMILALCRDLLAIARTTTEDPWAPGRDTPILTDQTTYEYNWTKLQGSGFLIGKVVGIVGVGAIGAAVAEMLGPYRVRLLYTQRHRLPAAEERRLGVEWREFDELIRESDAITLHHRLQEGPGGSERQFGSREFAMMKPTAFLINTARGRLLDEDALVDAIRNGEIGGVALDVFKREPLPKDHPLLSLAGDKVILTPHIAAGSEAEYWRHVLRIALEACEALPDYAAT